MTSNIVLSNQEFKTVGQRPIRHDGYDKVTGKALYGADMNLPGMLYGVVLRSPHGHARIKSIDTSNAEAHPDVRAVVTSADFPALDGDDVRPNLRRQSANLMARDKVLYRGHAVAAVAATSLQSADEAAALIAIDYEVLPSLNDAEVAMAPGAVLLHDEFENNVASHNEMVLGDIEKGFAAADLVIEREFRTSTVHQGYIEPHTATAWWTPQDKTTIWCSSQGHFGMRGETAAVLELIEADIKVVPMEIGGGFGGKTTVYLEPVALLLSRKSGQPVKVTMSRADVLEASGPTSGCYMKVKLGATNDGALVAGYADLRFEAGAFPGSPVGAAAVCMFSPYDIENLTIDAFDVVNNKPKTSAYRAPGAPQGAFAVETVIDELCEKLSVDPMDFRIRNAAKEGTRRITGMQNPRIGAVETYQAAKDHDHYVAPLEGPNRGRGVAAGFWMNGSGEACATATVNDDGSVGLTIGSVDIGGLRPVAAQQLAEVLGIPVETVNPQVGDTDTIGYSSVTGGSGAAFKTGWASYEAAQDVKRQMIERAAMIWERTADEIELVDGVFKHKSDSELSATFAEIARQTRRTGGPVVGSANLNPPGAGSAFGVHMVDVEVDPDTGKVTVLRYTVVQDAGKAIHPSYVEGQLQGGAVQGIGWALNEEYFMNDDGRMMNASFLDYRMPTSLDLPMIDTVIVEVANPGHPFGVRGVGEVAIVPPMAAVANAVYHAIGARMNVLPITPKAISEAMAK
ncbi:MAG: xanthine dehydrogenase family protein molybdopterin-binding subunit [SAR202 cluster bacterium]|nr:xanthine dehydrogenase family protein molybdopterin-binding subunit [SAR202 cluster bacterium]